MKKILILLLISVALLGCEKTEKPIKAEVFDKCLAQANQTFDSDVFLKSNFVMSCMVEKSYSFDKECVTNHTLQESQFHMFEVLKKLTASCYAEFN
jgi:hypothetical protein